MITCDLNSSNIQSIGWEPTQLVVTFHNGGTYLYRQVPKTLFDQMCKAPSAGKFFHQELKGKFEFEKVASKESVTN